MVLLIGNYPADRQQSMQRFATMMLRGLNRRRRPGRIDPPATISRPDPICRPLCRQVARLSRQVPFLPATAKTETLRGIRSRPHLRSLECDVPRTCRQSSRGRHLPRSSRRPRRARRSDRLPRVSHWKIFAALDRFRATQSRRGGLCLVGDVARRAAHRCAEGWAAAISTNTARPELSLSQTGGRDRASPPLPNRAARSQSSLRASRRFEFAHEKSRRSAAHFCPNEK